MTQRGSTTHSQNPSEQPTWLFRRPRPLDRARNSQVEKFFRSDDLANAVVREGIQNSLDAAVSDGSTGTKSINVQISIGVVAPSAIVSIVPELFEHLDAVREKLPEIPKRDEPVRYLAFEDFNTIGLTGDADEWDPPEDSKNAFFNFFRGEGVTSKSGNQRGRHGVGKVVFTTASRAKSIYGLTATAESGPLLMGTSTLTFHRRHGVSYDPDGWFGARKKVGEDDHIVPVRNSDLIERFSSIFGLERDSLPGLSIVVPWLDSSVDHNSVVSSVLRQYFWPILQRRLFVDVKSAEVGTTRITADSLTQLVSELKSDPPEIADDLRANFDLALWANDLAQKEIPSALLPAGDGAQNWDSSLLPEDVKCQLRDDLANGQPITLRIPLTIRKKGKPAALSEFHIHMRADPSCREGSVLFLREGLLISGVKCTRRPGYRALVVIEEGPLAWFLGDAENPSHMVWEKESLKNAYIFPPSCLKYVVQSVPSLLKTLHDEQKTADATLLLDLFSLPADSSTLPLKKSAKKKPKSGTETDPSQLVINSTKLKRYSLLKHSNGFVIRRGDPESEPPKTIDVEVAYGVRRGSPFRKYRPADFDLKTRSFSVDVKGGTIEHRDQNKLRVKIDSSDFEIAVTGFDTNRDLYIDPRLDRNTVEVSDGEED